MTEYKGILIRPRATEEDRRHYVTYASSQESILNWAHEIFYPSAMNIGCPRVPKEEWPEVELQVWKRTETKITTLSPQELKRPKDD